MESESLVSVIVPARNAASTLPECLEALKNQEFPSDRYEVIVVDDGSEDATAAIAGKFPVRVVSIPPSGPGAARNRGVERARGDLLLFTDADCAPDPGWIRTLATALEARGVAAVKGVYRTEQVGWTARFVQAEYESRYRLMEARETIDFIDTYSAGYRRDAFEAAGGFDESFRLPSVEDQELSFRLARMGARMEFCPGAVVAHKHADTALKYFRKKLKIAYWKMRVLARYPDKALADSHTPASLKAEILLMALTVASVPLAVAASLAWLPFVFLVGFLAVSARFSMALLPKNPSLALRAPFFLCIRAIALGLGMLLGLCGRPIRSRGGEQRMERDSTKRQLLESDA